MALLLGLIEEERKGMFIKELRSVAGSEKQDKDVTYGVFPYSHITRVTREENNVIMRRLTDFFAAPPRDAVEASNITAEGRPLLNNFC